MGRALSCAALFVAPLALSACGGRAHAPAPPLALHTTRVSGTARSGQPVPVGSSGGSTTATTPPSATSAPQTQSHGSSPARSSGAVPSPMAAAIKSAYETYLVDLSGLDDSLNKAWVDRVASVTTNRLAQASVRQAAALLSAQEHGVGVLRDDHVGIVMTGPTSAALADCQDEYHFYLVDDNSGSPDPFIGRGYFAGSAQMVLEQGRWLVDVFTTTHATCSY